MFNGKFFNEKFLFTRKYYDFACAINCTHKLTYVCACVCTCNRTCLKEQYASRLEPLQGGSLLFTTKFPEIPGTHFIDLRRMKGCLFSHLVFSLCPGYTVFLHYLFLAIACLNNLNFIYELILRLNICI